MSLSNEDIENVYISPLFLSWWIEVDIRRAEPDDFYWSSINWLCLPVVPFWHILGIWPLLVESIVFLSWDLQGIFYDIPIHILSTASSRQRSFVSKCECIVCKNVIEDFLEIHSHLVNMGAFFFTREYIFLEELSFFILIVSDFEENPDNSDALAVSIDSLSYNVDF